MFFSIANGQNRELTFYGFGRFDTLNFASEVLPPEFDLRETGDASMIKIQSNWGCWASAAISSIESFFASTQYSNTLLSDKNLFNFHGFDSSRTTYGNHYMATAFFTRGNGPVMEGTRYDTVKSTEPPLAALITEAVYLPDDPVIIKTAIKKCGSVYAMMNFVNTFYNDSTYLYCSYKNKKINHAVNIIGWNDTIGEGVWIIQNSRGPNFGNNGCFDICYQDVNFHDYNAIWTEWTDYDPDLAILYYDTCGSYNSYGFEDSLCYGMIGFSPEKQFDLNMIGTFINDSDTYVQAYIYNGFDSVFKKPGTLLYTTKEYCYKMPGYYTIKLDDPVSLTAGKTFYIIVKYVSPETHKPLPIENFIEKYCDPHLTSGRCWVNPDMEKWPETWYECGENSKWPSLRFDLCIKVYGFYRAE